MKLWKCSVCNYVHEGEQAPEVCPKCGVAHDKFNELDETQTKLVYMSDRTNDLLMQLDYLCTQLMSVAKEGNDIKLDPACVKTFTFANAKAWEIKQMAKAEIENHIGKGKW